MRKKAISGSLMTYYAKVSERDKAVNAPGTLLYR